MHPKYYCLEKSGAHSKLSFTSSNGSIGGRQMLNQLKSSTDSDPINVSLQRPHYYHYYRKNCHHHHHDYHHYHTRRLIIFIIIIWRVETLILSTPPMNTISIIFTKFSKECNTLLCESHHLNLLAERKE